MVNWDRISELREEIGEADLREVVSLFFWEIDEVLATLEAAPPAEMPGHLHFLKGSALNIGFAAVSSRCQAEEVRLKENPAATADIQGIRADYSASKAELEGLF